MIDLRGPGGQGVADAVVSFEPAAGVKGSWRLDTPREMKQQNIAFVPHVLVVPVGADVVFPNLDRVRHHVYSFSTAKRFELKLYGQEQQRSVHFDKAGLVAVGCNIHDRMSGFIDVVDTPYAAKTDGGGHAVLADVPDGPGKLDHLGGNAESASEHPGRARQRSRRYPSHPEPRSQARRVRDEHGQAGMTMDAGTHVQVS